MVRVENKIYTLVTDALSTAYPDMPVYGDAVPVSSDFPCATFYETSNTTYQKTLDAEHREHHAKLLYQADVYAVDNSKKSTAWGIMEVIDGVMLGLGFVRSYIGVVPNYDRTIYRLTARYTAVVSENTSADPTTKQHTIYRQ